MAHLQRNTILSCFLFFCMIVLVSSHNRRYTPPKVTRLTDFFSHVSINTSFSNLFGSQNFQILNNGSNATLALDKSSGAGLVSLKKYNYGFFSAAIKLPSGLSSGVVVAFYLSNADVYPRNHDEIDIELLGNDRSGDWVFQTNVYANGSVSTGREEKFYLWFDPTKEYHHYSIIWNNHHTVFLVDNIPVREFTRNSAFPMVYPLKPMSVYATIWDGSEWATRGGKYPVNYEYAPFVASFSEMEMSGCIYDPKAPVSQCSKDNPSSLDPVEGPEFVKLSPEQVTALSWARCKLMIYSYCKDIKRYKVMPPECR